MALTVESLDGDGDSVVVDSELWPLSPASRTLLALLQTLKPQALAISFCAMKGCHDYRAQRQGLPREIPGTVRWQLGEGLGDRVEGITLSITLSLAHTLLQPQTLTTARP